VVALGVEPQVTIDELLRNPDRRKYASLPESDKPAEEDALLEADLRDVRYDLTTAEARLLVDVRPGLEIRNRDVAVVVLREVTSFEVTGVEKPRRGPWFARLVMRSRLSARDNLFTFEVGCLNGTDVTVTAQAAEFFVGDIPGLPDAQPSFPEDDELTIVAGMPWWDSEFVPSGATFIDRHPDRQPWPAPGISR
jgi:hypothetical protein